MNETLPTVALSIQQPWAWLIVNGRKDIENRTWRTRFRGPVLIHAGKAIDRDALTELWLGYHPVTGGEWPFRPDPEALHRGGIVGIAEITDCVEASRSDWFVGPYGFVMRNARPLPFRPCKGALGFFQVRP
jgi:hypothetical protein